jgi:mannitol/fructose-specific phosphotransferase system IIA component (Ntr-type)
MKLCDFIAENAIIVDLQSTDRNGVLREMIQSLADHGHLAEDDVEPIVRALVHRENQGSTGFGKGVAVPHVKHERVKAMAGTIARSSRGVDFAALDRAPVYTVVLLLSPTNEPDKHLEAMENLFRHLQKDTFRKFLRQSTSVEEIVDLIHEADGETPAR